jgi:hypothetical protein
MTPERAITSTALPATTSQMGALLANHRAPSGLAGDVARVDDGLGFDKQRREGLVDALRRAHSVRGLRQPGRSTRALRWPSIELLP